MQSRVLTSGRAVASDTEARARQRAIDEDIQVRKISGSDVWTATSGKDRLKAYGVIIRDGRFVSCSCKAGEFGNYCKHRAAWEMAQESKGDAA